MKKKMLSIVLIIVLVCINCPTYVVAATGDPTLTVVPVSTTVPMGGTIEIQLSMANLPVPKGGCSVQFGIVPSNLEWMEARSYEIRADAPQTWKDKVGGLGKWGMKVTTLSKEPFVDGNIGKLKLKLKDGFSGQLTLDVIDEEVGIFPTFETFIPDIPPIVINVKAPPDTNNNLASLSI
ncbi:MAG: hypothetical protein RR645_08155, partial [Clostridium sp.]